MEFENLNKVQKMYAFSDQEMSNYLEIDRATLYRWKEAGEIPEFKISHFLKKKRVVQDMIQNILFKISMFSSQRKGKIWAV